MAKDSGAASSPSSAAVKALIADGTYKKIFDYWGLSGPRRSTTRPINGAID